MSEWRFLSNRFKCDPLTALLFNTLCVYFPDPSSVKYSLPLLYTLLYSTLLLLLSPFCHLILSLVNLVQVTVLNFSSFLVRSQLEKLFSIYFLRERLINWLERIKHLSALRNKSYEDEIWGYRFHWTS